MLGIVSLTCILADFGGYLIFYASRSTAKRLPGYILQSTTAWQHTKPTASASTTFGPWGTTVHDRFSKRQ